MFGARLCVFEFALFGNHPRQGVISLPRTMARSYQEEAIPTKGHLEMANRLVHLALGLIYIAESTVSPPDTKFLAFLWKKNYCARSSPPRGVEEADRKICLCSHVTKLFEKSGCFSCLRYPFLVQAYSPIRVRSAFQRLSNPRIIPLLPPEFQEASGESFAFHRTPERAEKP